MNLATINYIINNKKFLNIISNKINIKINNTNNTNKSIKTINNLINNKSIKINNLIKNKISNSRISNSKISNKYALIIGCNYIGTEYELNGCINDAQNLQNKLISQYKFNNIKVLTDNTLQKPTKLNILNEFKNLLINAKAGDILFFCFSGHGTQTYDKSGDEKDKLDELIVPLDLNYIIDDEFNNLIRTYLKKNVNLFALFDSCHSGTILDLKYEYKTKTNKSIINTKYKNTNGNVILISGCMDSQYSADAYINKKFQGAMTWSFLESINKNPSIKWFDLINNMCSLLKSNGYTQIPCLTSGNLISNSNNYL